MYRTPFHAGRTTCQAMGAIDMRPVIADWHVEFVARPTDSTRPTANRSVPARYQPRWPDGRFARYALLDCLLSLDIEETHDQADWEDFWRRTWTF